MDSQELTMYYGMLFKKKGDKYYCNGAFGRFIDELSIRYKKVYLVVPIQESIPNDSELDYCIASNNIVIQELPEYDGFISAYKKYKIIKKTLLEHSDLWNGIVYIRWPVPFFNFVYKTAKRKSLPVIFHLVGDTKAVVVNGDKYRGLIKWIAVKVAEYDSQIMKQLLKKTPALVNGSGLRRLYAKEDPNIKEIRTSTFSENEIEEPSYDFKRDHLRVLYVGYLRHEKGLEYLIKAIKSVINQGIDLKLTIVGDGGIKGVLQELANELQIEDKIDFKGYISFGDDLLNIYRENDIFVLPSISEGTPRVLIEAMSKGLPVIATNVGGIPYTIEDGYNGLLVPSKDPDAIAKSIIKISNNENLRIELINNGLKFAKENTLEKHVDEVYNFMKSNCDSIMLINSKKEKITRFLFTSVPIHLIMLLTALLPNSKPSNKIRGFLLRPFFKSAGKNLQIASGVIINLINNITVGDNVYIAHNAWINGAGGLEIEDNVVIGPFTVIATTEHVYSRGKYRNDISKIAPIKIGEGTWIASHVVLSAGISVGCGCLIAAGAVVTKDTTAYTLNGGVPSKQLKKLIE